MALEKNADVSQSGGESGQTPLYGACLWAHTDIVRLLLERNVDVSQCGGRWGENPLFGACLMGRTDIVRLLLEKNTNPKQRVRGLTPLVHMM